MDISSSLILGLTLSAGKFLLKKFIGDAGKATDATPDPAAVAGGGLGAIAGEIVGDALAGVAKDRIKDVIDRRTAARRFEDIGDDLARRLVADLQNRHRNVPQARLEAVLDRVTAALAGNITADFVVRNQVDPAKLFAARKPQEPYRPLDIRGL